MAERLRANVPGAALALAAVAVMSWLGLHDFAWSDYDTEAAPAYAALVHGHVARFLGLLPAYGGSLELRAPFALLPGLFGGGELAVYRVAALPCLLAGAALGLWLSRRMQAAGHSRLSRGVALSICVANPITVQALIIGHPEELLGAVLCVAAVLLAARERPVWAGLLLGLAVANKQWALLAAGPVLLALPAAGGGQGRPRIKAALVAGAVAVALLLPMLGLAPGATASRVAVTQTGVIFRPQQVFWFAGGDGRGERNVYGALKPGFRTPPHWLDGLAHPLIVALVIPLTLLCRRRKGAERQLADALLLLALLFLLRCLLDPWDGVYYPLPFVLALLAWETTTRATPPIRSLAATAAVYASFVWLPQHATADMTSVITMALALPAAGGLAAALYRRPEPAPRPRADRARSPGLSRRSAAPS